MRYNVSGELFVKVAIVRTTLHRGSGQVVHIRELVRKLLKMGLEVSIFCREVEGEIDLPNIYLAKFFFDKLLFIRHFGFAFEAGLMAQDFDIIHTQYHPDIFAGNVSHFLKSKAHVFTFHGFTPATVWRNPRQMIKMVDHQIGTAIALRLGVDQVIAVSDFLKRELVQFYRFDAEKVNVIYNGIDTQKFNPEIDGLKIRGKYGVGSNPLVLFLGRLAPYKGPQFLIMAAPQILKEVPDAKFVIAGSGRHEIPQLKILVKKLNLEKAFIFTGYVTDWEIPYLYASCDVFCYPSLWEGFGLTPAEAQACGKPVVAFNISAIPEVVKNRETGILVPPKDYTKLAPAIIQLLSDKKAREKMGHKGRQRVLRLFSWDNVAKETIKVYQKALELQGRRT